MSLNILLSHSRSLNGTIRKLGYGYNFLFGFYTMALYCIFSEIKRVICRKFRFFHTPPPFDASPSEYCHKGWYGRTGMLRVPDGKKIYDMFSRFNRIPACDTRTDRRGGLRGKGRKEWTWQGKEKEKKTRNNTNKGEGQWILTSKPLNTPWTAVSCGHASETYQTSQTDERSFLWLHTAGILFSPCYVVL